MPWSLGSLSWCGKAPHRSLPQDFPGKGWQNHCWWLWRSFGYKFFTQQGFMLCMVNESKGLNSKPLVYINNAILYIDNSVHMNHWSTWSWKTELTMRKTDLVPNFDSFPLVATDSKKPNSWWPIISNMVTSFLGMIKPISSISMQSWVGFPLLIIHWDLACQLHALCSGPSSRPALKSASVTNFLVHLYWSAAEPMPTGLLGLDWGLP